MQLRPYLPENVEETIWQTFGETNSLFAVKKFGKGYTKSRCYTSPLKDYSYLPF